MRREYRRRRLAAFIFWLFLQSKLFMLILEQNPNPEPCYQDQSSQKNEITHSRSVEGLFPIKIHCFISLLLIQIADKNILLHFLFPNTSYSISEVSFLFKTTDTWVSHIQIQTEKCTTMETKLAKTPCNAHHVNNLRDKPLEGAKKPICWAWAYIREVSGATGG